MRPSRRSAMTTPAVRAAALDPMPLPTGMSLSISNWTAGMLMRWLAATARLVCQIRLSGPVEMQPASRPDTEIESFPPARKRHVR